MGIEVYPNTKVYVMTPANVATGGPELLHQLVYHLRNDLGIDAYMYYFPENHTNPVHPDYKNYNNPYENYIEDKEENILIIPERYEYICHILNDIKLSKTKKVIWWLSVDNFIASFISSNKKKFIYYKIVNKSIRREIYNIKEKALEIFFKNNYNYKYVTTINKKFFNTLKKEFQYHLAQSYYAIDFLKEIGIITNENLDYLSDYLNKDFLKIETDLSKKENIVAYNPKKGYSFTKKLRENAKDITFVPIKNMSRKEVIELLKKAKVYIDFGNHPGKDRIPREAAILGCCVITGKKGSARYYKDVSIPEKYKFEDKEQNIPKIIEQIQDCFENFQKRYNDFNYYRQVIKKEPNRFLEDLEKTFIKINL